MAGMRTDLDSFTDAEAFALMADGYLLATQSITSASLGFEVLGGDLRVDWPFDEVIGLLACPTVRSPLSCHLQAGSHRFLKAWQQVRWLRLTGIALLAVLAVAGFCAVVCLWNTVLITLSLGRLVSVVLAIALSVSGLGWLARGIWPADTLRQLLLACAMAFGGWVLANLHLRFVDPVFLAHGRVGRRE